jgi:predicted metal-dependent HD superfamily phosphohydrolase
MKKIIVPKNHLTFEKVEAMRSRDFQRLHHIDAMLHSLQQFRAGQAVSSENIEAAHWNETDMVIKIMLFKLTVNRQEFA